MKKFFLIVVLACAFLPAATLAQDGQGGNNNNQGGNNNNQGGNSISATEMSEIGLAAATLLGALAYLGMRKRSRAK